MFFGWIGNIGKEKGGEQQRLRFRKSAGYGRIDGEPGGVSLQKSRNRKRSRMHRILFICWGSIRRNLEKPSVFGTLRDVQKRI